MPISDALRRIYASGDPDRRYVETLQITHPAMTKAYYLTNDMQPWDFELEDGSVQTFDQMPFQIVLPKHDGEGRQDMNVTIGGVDQTIIEELELANEQPNDPLVITYRVYLDVANSQPQNDPPLTLTITQVSASMLSITGTAGRADILNRRFPKRVYTITEFPGLRR